MSENKIVDVGFDVWLTYKCKEIIYVVTDNKYAFLETVKVEERDKLKYILSLSEYAPEVLLDSLRKENKDRKPLSEATPEEKGAIIFCIDEITSQDEKITNLLSELWNSGANVFVQEREETNHIVGNIDDIQSILNNEYKAKYSSSGALNAFIQNTFKHKDEITPTGIKGLDNALNGGLREGLYFFGAGSSMGKTTFTMQIADEIAKQGKDVIVFALEMSQDELIAKSLSRETACICQASKEPFAYALTSPMIQSGNIVNRENPTDRNSRLYLQSIANYKEYAKHIYIYEAIGKYTPALIRKKVLKHIQCTHNKPVIIIDYFQLLTNEDSKIAVNDKLKADVNALALKQLSREFKIPVFCISSFNRDNYTKQIDFNSFKESGGIDYSSDVIFGLQFRDFIPSDRTTEISANRKTFLELKQKDKRPLELVIIKNRKGAIPAPIAIDYYPAYNYFIEP